MIKIVTRLSTNRNQASALSHRSRPMISHASQRHGAQIASSALPRAVLRCTYDRNRGKRLLGRRSSRHYRSVHNEVTMPFQVWLISTWMWERKGADTVSTSTSCGNMGFTGSEQASSQHVALICHIAREKTLAQKRARWQSNHCVVCFPILAISHESIDMYKLEGTVN